MDRNNIKNGWEFYRAYLSINRHIMSKKNGWKYDLFRQGLWDKIDPKKFLNDSDKIELWGRVSAEVVEEFPSINRMDILRALSMTFFSNDNKFYAHKNSGSNVITNYRKYKNLLSLSTERFKIEINEIARDYKSQGLTIKDGLVKIGNDDIPDIMYKYYQDKISLTTLYILNNLYKASNPNKLSLMTYLRNIDDKDVFLKLFSKDIDIWELMFEFNYSEIGKIYVEAYNANR